MKNPNKYKCLEGAEISVNKNCKAIFYKTEKGDNLVEIKTFNGKRQVVITEDTFNYIYVALAELKSRETA